MYVKTYATSIHGIDAVLVTVEVDISQGLYTYISGLPDNAIKESRQRIEAALKNAGYYYPGKKVIINYSPADIKKEGSQFDLATALSILQASGQINLLHLENFIILGELSLDGHVLPVRGVLPSSILCRQLNFKGIIVPFENYPEAYVISGIDVIGVRNLQEVIDLLSQNEPMKKYTSPSISLPQKKENELYDFRDVKGQENVKRALLIAAAGGHNILMIGPPGSGKSMMARRIPGILPPLSEQEAIETTKVYSVAGKLKRSSGLIQERPFRAPHHTISDVALIGGGTIPQPGEISLAHNGVLFLDELPEFNRSVLEVLRQPLEDRIVTISRAKSSVEFPANIMLIAAMNPCPCGYYNHPSKACHCTPTAIQRYTSKISGPLLDRIDIHVEVVPVPIQKLASYTEGESSASLREKVINARSIQLERYRNDGIYTNSQLTPSLLKKYCRIDDTTMELLKKAIQRLHLSARSYDRILRVARTIADLDASIHIQSQHVAEAIMYRTLDKETWGKISLG
ncbi:MAG: YifB family Mg chelatase-like AAA ATPase [Bacteroidales bacterium]|nr:YifB family Mg chelatase-like AAA ATPase [Bacteroidales bacterium]